jgi:hypothetical protein
VHSASSSSWTDVDYIALLNLAYPWICPLQMILRLCFPSNLSLFFQFWAFQLTALCAPTRHPDPRHQQVAALPSFSAAKMVLEDSRRSCYAPLA